MLMGGRPVAACLGPASRRIWRAAPQAAPYLSAPHEIWAECRRPFQQAPAFACASARCRSLFAARLSSFSSHFSLCFSRLNSIRALLVSSFCCFLDSTPLQPLTATREPLVEGSPVASVSSSSLSSSDSESNQTVARSLSGSTHSQAAPQRTWPSSSTRSSRRQRSSSVTSCRGPDSHEPPKIQSACRTTAQPPAMRPLGAGAAAPAAAPAVPMRASASAPPPVARSAGGRAAGSSRGTGMGQPSPAAGQRRDHTAARPASQSSRKSSFMKSETSLAPLDAGLQEAGTRKSTTPPKTRRRLGFCGDTAHWQRPLLAPGPWPCVASGSHTAQGALVDAEVSRRACHKSSSTSKSSPPFLGRVPP
mmetsp:Transcript_33296/g.105439  ORF Transcript_33296/g.105439 Transcript_33296/m.105439 type:complete len:363 (+) Transcript_33296:15-1103(+)